jgi:hypothetical protein
MSTATIEKRGRKDKENIPATRTDSADLAYRQVVFAAGKSEGDTEPDRKILADALRLPSDFLTDKKTYRARLRAAADLADVVPKLEKEAARLARVASDDGGGRAVKDFATVAELFQSFERYRIANSPGYVGPEKEEAHQAKMQATRARVEAMNVLIGTADPDLDRQATELRHEIQRIVARITSRRPLTNLENRISEQTELVEKLATGGRPRQLMNDPKDVRDLWKLARAELRGLMAQRPLVAGAVDENRVDQRRIADLEKQIGELTAAKLVPERMAWSS